MGQDQAGVFEPQLTPKQQVQIQDSWPPALLSLAIAAAAPFQLVQMLQQLQRRQLRGRTLHLSEKKDCVAIGVLTWGPPEGLGRQKRGTADLARIDISPRHNPVAQSRSNPTQGGFRRAMRTAQIGPKPNRES